MFGQKTCKTVRYSYGFTLGAYSIVVGALFIWQVLSIYHSGGADPFTREKVFAALSKMALPFWLWIAMIIAGAVLFEVFPFKEKPSKISPDLQLARLYKRMPATAPEGMESEFALVSSNKRVISAVKIAAWALFGIACLWGVIYLCLPANFTKGASEHTADEEVLALVKNVFPCIFAGILTLCAAGIYEKYTVKRILPAAKKVAGRERTTPLKWYEKVDKVFDNKWVMLGIRIAVAVLAVAFIIWGCFNGSARLVFTKAITLCMQCVGIG